MNTHCGMQFLLIVVLLGIGFTAVLGALLPMMHRRLRSWIYALLCGAALSTLIETT